MRSKAEDVQLAMPVDDPAEAAREAERERDEHHELVEQFFAACRAYVRDESSYEVVATELEAIWGELGRHVSTGVLKNTLSKNEDVKRGQYFRFEWAIYFARKSEACAEVLAQIIGRGKPKKSEGDELRDLKTVIRREYPRQAEALIRKGEAL